MLCYYAAAMLLVPKKNNKIQALLDARGLNKKIIFRRFPCIRIPDLFNSLGNIGIMSILDLKNGFFQLKIAESAQKYFGFSVLNEQFVFQKLIMKVTR